VTIDGNRPSKTQRKKQVHALQDLGAELVELGAEQLAAIELPDTLRDAVMEARTITKFEARRRQLQYIGKLMRRVDPAPIRAALDACQAPSRSHALLHKRIEAWRERLLDDPNALGALVAENPRADPRHLESLVASALREREANRPPRAFREIYQALHALLTKDEG
jgi:ribosome-associated protein